MAEASNPTTDQSPESGGFVSWKIAAVLAVIALLAGIMLGRISFFSSDDPTPRVVRVTMEDDDLEGGGNVEYLEDQEIYILSLDALPPVEGQVYQVWAQRDDLIVNAGVLNPDSRTFAFAAYSGRYDTIFITSEPAPLGSEQPTSDALVTADLTELEEEDDE